MDSKNEDNVIKNEPDQADSLLNDPAEVESVLEAYTVEEKAPVKKVRSIYGIVFALLAAFCLAMANIMARKANFFSGTDATAIRYMVQFLVALIIGLSNKVNLIGDKQYRKTLVFSGIVFSLGATVMFLSVKLINPSDVMALYQLNMVFIPIIARFYLKEKFRLYNILPLILSILGVIFISQPSFLFKKDEIINCDFNLTNCTNTNDSNFLNRLIGIKLGALCGMIVGLAIVLSRKIAKKNIDFTVPVIYQSFFGIPICILLSLLFYLIGHQKYDMTLVKDVPSILFQILYTILAGLFGSFLQVFLNLAVKYEESLKVSMIYSNSLLFSFLFQFLILNLSSNLFSTIGALLIFSATLLIIIFQMLEKKSFKNQSTDDTNDQDIPAWKRILFFKV